MSEAHVFESHTRPGTWFWLAPDGRNGWTQSELEAWGHIDRCERWRRDP